MKAAAIIPAYNEAAAIASVVEGVRPIVDRVIVVDDGSTDGTAERANGAGADVIVHPRNRGKGYAVRTGLTRAFEADVTHVLLLDGDMQHLPAEARALLDEAERSGADVVIGERMFDRSRMPASRYRANMIGSRVCRGSSACRCATRSAGSASSALTCCKASHCTPPATR